MNILNLMSISWGEKPTSATSRASRWKWRRHHDFSETYVATSTSAVADPKAERKPNIYLRTESIILKQLVPNPNIQTAFGVEHWLG